MSEKRFRRFLLHHLKAQLRSFMCDVLHIIARGQIFFFDFFFFFLTQKCSDVHDFKLTQIKSSEDKTKPLLQA